MEWWNNATTLARVGIYVPYFALLVGTVVTATGIYIKVQFDNRVVELRERAATERKNTPPLISARMGLSSSSGELRLEVNCMNDIPFDTNWTVVTRDNQLVSGFPLEKVRVVPKEDRTRFMYRVSINEEKVVDDYIELSFRYESAYSSELNNPAHLSGEIVEKYKYVDGRLYEWKE